ncbi:fumarylacetoacetate hydrolase family protein [Brevibacillus choshinensis]|uniref:fumarylacetoacetate hydrolase family protein n=1 Tax=Brevibacillus choshinensis TaxID=54911 RepID=UPI002E22F410|nr:fumarylacetoacetate hydrolase family protein [Brevibacillus choshinensis]MED4782868.1 fumarylacetoacetate hydrolase family protein [Brevibacillus choshinensis]
MKIAVFNDNRLGVIQRDQVFDVSHSVLWDREHVQESLVNLMTHYDECKAKMEAALSSADSYPFSEVKLQAPVPKPSKILAAPVNYLNHQSEMQAKFNNAPFTIEKLGLFLKAPSSIIGPGETILLPFKDRRHDHEAELGFVIGKEAKNVKASDAHQYIFGYFALMDITVRGSEERTWRKSYDTFTPIGPWIVTSDEIEDPHQLQMDLWVNEELRQSTNIQAIIWDCFKCLEEASHAMTLYPGDIIATGTPEGVGPITKGDQVRIQIEKIGEFSVNVDFREDTEHKAEDKDEVKQ